MSVLPDEESHRRISALQSRLRSLDPPLDAAILVQNVDVYYFAGTFQTCHLLVPAAAPPRLLVRKVLERAEAESPIDDVRPIASLRELDSHLAEVCGEPPWRVGLELDVLPVKTFEVYRGLLGEKAELVDVSETVLALRSVKSKWEIERIEAASRLIARVFSDLPAFLNENLSTYELQAILECRARTAGHPGFIRMRGLNVECAMGILVSGPGGAVPSHSIFPIGGRGFDVSAPVGGDFEKIAPDTPVMLDFLGCADGYYADQSRMAVKGRFPAEAGRIFQVMQEVLRYCERTIRAGSVPADIYAGAVKLVEESGLGPGFQGPPGYSVGFLGHGVGLEVNEAPVLAPKFVRPLEAGTVIAIEPKFTHPSFGVIGLENTYAVRENGLQNLTPIPETVTVVSS